MSGPTRKLLGLTFTGETRDADGQVWGDVEIDGLPNDVGVSLPCLYCFSLTLVKYWHVWGNPGKWRSVARFLPVPQT